MNPRLLVPALLLLTPCHAAVGGEGGEWLRFTHPSGQEAREFYEGSGTVAMDLTIGYQWGEGDPAKSFRAFLRKRGEVSAVGRGEMGVAGGDPPRADRNVDRGIDRGMRHAIPQQRHDHGADRTGGGVPQPSGVTKGGDARVVEITKPVEPPWREVTALFHPPIAPGGEPVGRRGGVLWSNRSLNSGGKGYTEVVSLERLFRGAGDYELMFEVVDLKGGRREVYPYRLTYTMREGPEPLPARATRGITMTREEYDRMTTEELMRLYLEQVNGGRALEHPGAP